MYFVYILECKDKTLYTGITTDVERRFAEHKAGKGGAYTRSHLPVKVVYTERKKNRATASKREYQIKSLSRKQKLQIIKNRL